MTCPERVAILPDNYRLSLPVGSQRWTQPLNRPPSTDGKWQTIDARRNDGLYCILPADGSQVAVVLSCRLVGRPPVLLDHFRMNLSNLLLVLVDTVLVVVANLPHARRVDQELCKVAHTSQRRQWTGVMLFYTRNHSLSATLVVFGQSLFPTAGTATNACHRGKGALVPILATCPFYTGCP